MHSVASWCFCVTSASAFVACLDSKRDDSVFERTVDGNAVEVIPIDRDVIIEYDKNLLIDLRDTFRVYVIDGTAPEESLIATPLICPNGMRTNVADFLLGQSIGWGARGELVAISSAPVALTEQVVNELDVCKMTCSVCSDGATVCIPDEDCPSGPAQVSGLTSQWYDETGNTREDENVNPPGWAGSPPEGDPAPYSGNGWEGGSGTDPRAGDGGWDSGGGSGYDSGSGSGGGSSGGDGGNGGGGGGGQDPF